MPPRDKNLNVNILETKLFEPRVCRYCGKKFNPAYCNQWVHVSCFQLYRRKYHREYQKNYRRGLRRTTPYNEAR